MSRHIIITTIVCVMVSLWGIVSHASQNKFKDSAKLAEMHTLNRINTLRGVDSIATALALVDSLLVKDSTSPKLLTLKGELLLLAGDTTMAETILTDVIASIPIVSAARQLLVAIEIERGKYDDARKNITYLKMVGRNKHKVLFLQGRCFEAQNKPDSAAMYYQKAVEHLLKKKRLVP